MRDPFPLVQEICGGSGGERMNRESGIYVPGIAGISPTYTFRQLYSFKDGSRNGALAGLMQNVVTNLDESDMIAIAAYTATIPN